MFSTKRSFNETFPRHWLTIGLKSIGRLSYLTLDPQIFPYQLKNVEHKDKYMDIWELELLRIHRIPFYTIYPNSSAVLKGTTERPTGKNMVGCSIKNRKVAHICQQHCRVVKNERHFSHLSCTTKI